MYECTLAIIHWTNFYKEIWGGGGVREWNRNMSVIAYGRDMF